MRYKVGDKVKLKDNIELIVDEHFGLFQGKVLEIIEIDETYDYPYTISVEGEKVMFCDDDIECKVQEFSSIKELIALENNDKYKQHEQICKKLNDIYISKNKDYGDSFLKVRKEYPEAVIIRLMDKLERLKTLYKGQERLVNDESIEDSLMDMANYCIMEIMEVEKDV